MNELLRTTSIERFHLLDASPGFPNTIACHLVIHGELDRQAADQALRASLMRGSIVPTKISANKRHFVPDSKLITQARFVKMSPNKSPTSVKIDPQVDGGGKFLLQSSGQKHRLMMVTHHAYVDGLGGMQFAIDWMTEYHNLVCGDDVKLRGLDHRLLHRRNKLGLLTSQFLSSLIFQPVAILGSTKFLIRKIVSFGTPARAKKPRTRMINLTLGISESKKYKEAASAQQKTMNDLFLRDIFLGMHRYRVKQGLHEKNEWLRILVPISIRKFSDRKLPICNRASIIQIDRRDRDFADRNELAWGINREIGSIQKWQLDRTFLLIIRLLSLIPGALKRSVNKDRCRATTIVTNLGGPFDRIKLPRENHKIKLGNAVLEDLDLVAPLRRWTPICFAVSKYGEQIKISMHYHQDCIRDDDAELLTQEIEAEINQTVATVSDSDEDHENRPEGKDTTVSQAEGASSFDK